MLLLGRRAGWGVVSTAAWDDVWRRQKLVGAYAAVPLESDVGAPGRARTAIHDRCRTIVEPHVPSILLLDGFCTAPCQGGARASGRGRA